MRLAPLRQHVTLVHQWIMRRGHAALRATHGRLPSARRVSRIASFVLCRPCSLALGLLAILACSGVASRTNAFATMAEARDAGAVRQGWVPDGLPPHAHDLREAHLLNSSKRWGLFEYPQSEEEALRALLQPQEISLDGEHCDIPARIEWWPVALRRNLDGARIAATGIRAYRSKAGDLIFAINWQQGRAYYWTP